MRKMAKLASNLDEGFNHSSGNHNPKMMTEMTSVSHRKPKKLAFGDSLVAPLEKIEVPNHVLNTSELLCENTVNRDVELLLK